MTRAETVSRGQLGGRQTMTTFSTLSEGSGLTDVLKAFPRNSGLLLDLVNAVMCGKGELTRGEREAIASAVSRQNEVPYCVFYHTIFSEVFSGPIDATNRRLAPLIDYARHLNAGSRVDLDRAFAEAREAGWSETAIYEVVEVCGLFDLINCIVRAANLPEPTSAPNPMPTEEGLKDSYLAMAVNAGLK